MTKHGEIRIKNIVKNTTKNILRVIKEKNILNKIKIK